MWPTTLTVTLFPLFSFFSRLYPREQVYPFKCEPTHLQFELRHQHAVSADTRVVFSDVPQAPTSALTRENGTIYTIKTKRISSFRPPSFRAHEAARLRSIRHAQSTDLPWWEDEIVAPDVEHRESLLELAKMTNNAYVTPDDAEWYELREDWNDRYPFGWEPDSDGFRGYVFATPDNATVVFSIKGTSTALFGSGGPTGKKDRLNDNLLFSCCCARIDWSWTTVCGCYRGGWKCDQTCLAQALTEETLFYAIGTNLYNNIAYMYPTANIWIIGHSLGGALASLLGVTFGVPVVAFESPGEKLAAQRLHLPSPPSTHHVTHVYHTADPIAMGTCNGILSSCALGGYAMETKCHLGTSILYDTVSNLSWAVDVRKHGIVNVIDNILDKPWQPSVEVGREAPLAKPETECVSQRRETQLLRVDHDLEQLEMIVPITVTPPNAFSAKLPPSIAKLGHDELFLIELQGTLDVVLGSESTCKDGQLIGTLNTADMNKPMLMIGHHLLEGKAVNLPKPLGVLQKHVRNFVPASVHAADDSEDEGEKENKQVRWDVTAVVKKKIVFSKRPMPITKPASTASRRDVTQDVVCA
ncbi:Alpha/Beta hydrolase protein [Butyriboletus roseoflavus]|nr:Alpha/Beta hydrolase protein [Butyriboletus roseoflavus]